MPTTSWSPGHSLILSILICIISNTFLLHLSLAYLKLLHLQYSNVLFESATCATRTHPWLRLISGSTATNPSRTVSVGGWRGVICHMTQSEPMSMPLRIPIDKNHTWMFCWRDVFACAQSTKDPLINPLNPYCSSNFCLSLKHSSYRVEWVLFCLLWLGTVLIWFFSKANNNNNNNKKNQCPIT